MKKAFVTFLALGIVSAFAVEKGDDKYAETSCPAAWRHPVVMGKRFTDAVTGKALDGTGGRMTLRIKPGDFRLVEVACGDR